jgi:hypothetical protein
MRPALPLKNKPTRTLPSRSTHVSRFAVEPFIFGNLTSPGLARSLEEVKRDALRTVKRQMLFVASGIS